MTERIRWEPTKYGGWTGHVGTARDFLFQVWLADASAGGWQLDSTLPGQFGSGWHRCDSDPDALKAEAERWLSEFVSSLGAVFPDAPAAIFADMTDEEAFEAAFRARLAPGRRVRFKHADAGYPADQKMAVDLLTFGEVYTIAWSDIGFSSSRIGLAGVESRGQGFNSVLFETVDDAEPPHPED